MPYNFRNRDEIRAPARFDEPQDEQRKVSYLEPDLDEEVYRSSPPKSSRLKYRGPMISFNPDLPPAAFPTLDHPDQARLPTSRIMRPDLAWLRPQHIGTADSILNDNMRRMYAAGQLNSFDRNFLEMMSSEDEDEDEDDTPPPSLENVRWNDLSPASKLQLYDVVSEAYPSGEATLRLQLDDIEVEELTDLVLKRNECLRKEDEEGSGHRRELHEKLLRGALVSQPKFRELLDLNLFQHVRGVEDEYYNGGLLSDFVDIERAKAYLTSCRLNQGLLTGAWATIPNANSTALGRNKGNSLSSPTLSQYHKSHIRHLAGMIPQKSTSITPQSPLRHKISTGGPASSEKRHHAPRKDPYDASDDSRSPSKDRRLQSRPRTQLQIPHSRNMQREPSRDRQSSGFIRPSLELGESTIATRLLPTVENAYPPGSSRTAAIEANRAALDQQIAEAARKKLSTPLDTPMSVERRASTELEMSFLNNERRPGARQPKLTEKAIGAEVAASRSTAAVHLKKRTSDRSIVENEGHITITDLDGRGDGTAMERKDSAIDLSADREDDEDELGLV